ncbi:hypothetical protein [Citrobacter braakii]|uniref:hypothetical protein n=1 Tax=Citrobacter braakii TaxID=57706 RepID=UPI0040395816
MIAIDKLRAFFMHQFDVSAIMEPNNAMARRSVRIAQTGMALNPLSMKVPFTDRVPYELLLKLQVTLRLSGGNAGDWLTHQIIESGVGFHCHLGDDLVVLKDVAETLPFLDSPDSDSGFFGAEIVGDAELTDVKRVGSGYEHGAQNTFEPDGNLYTYSEVWTCTLVLTLHRLFNNPHLKQVVFAPDNDDPLIVTTKQPRES